MALSKYTKEDIIDYPGNDVKFVRLQFGHFRHFEECGHYDKPSGKSAG